MWLDPGARPRPPRETWAANPVFQTIQEGYDRHHAEHPEFMGVHYIAADQVEECWQVLRQSMRSVSYECLAYLPTYSSWLQEQDWAVAYHRHRRNLQLIGLNDRRPPLGAEESRATSSRSTHCSTVYPDALGDPDPPCPPRTAIASAVQPGRAGHSGMVGALPRRGDRPGSAGTVGARPPAASRPRGPGTIRRGSATSPMTISPLTRRHASSRSYARFGAAAHRPGRGRHAGPARAEQRRRLAAGARYALADFGLTGDEVDERSQRTPRAEAPARPGRPQSSPSVSPHGFEEAGDTMPFITR